MAMVTQCPHCNTAFNVTPEQLFARDGRVRCGHCKQVFDGLVNLTSLEALQAGVPPPLAEASDAELRAKVVADDAQRPTLDAGFSPLNWPMVPEVPVVPMPPAAIMSVEDAVPVTSESVQAGEDAQIDAQGAVSTEPAAATPEDERPVPLQRPSWPWAVAATLAAFALRAQALYVFRSDIAAHVPGVRPALAQLCAWVQCSIRPLQKPSALAIQASDLLILDKAQPHRVQLIVTMQNMAAVEVGYPAIDLVLNDRFDHAVARRVFVPAEYVQKFDPQTSAIAASGTTTVRIDLDVSELSAGGFALLLIPAPQT
jgi:predicted Zn finger-like uncharacterized protein